MPTFTTTQGIGQFISRPVGTVSSSQTATLSYAPPIIFELVLQEYPFSVGEREPNQIDEQSLSQLYAEFAEEDRNLANAGLRQYVRGLEDEDREG